MYSKSLFAFFLITLLFQAMPELWAENHPPSLTMKVKNGYMHIEAFTENILHVTFSRDPGYISKYSPVNDPGRMPSAIIQQTKKTGSLKTSALLCEISMKSGLLSIKDSSGKTVFVETFLPGKLKGTPGKNNTANYTQAFKITGDEGLYGLVKTSEPVLNWHSLLNTTIRLDPSAHVPCLISTNNYAIIWVNTTGTEFRCSSTTMSFSSASAAGIDFFLITGRNTAEVMASTKQLRGSPPFLPLRAYGYWHSIERDKTGQQILQTAADYRSGKIPVDVFAGDGKDSEDYTALPLSRDISRSILPGPISDSLYQKYNIDYLLRSGPEKQVKIPGSAVGASAAEFTGMKNRIASTVNYCVSGNPFDDAASVSSVPSGQGSLYPVGIEDMAYREEYIRYLQFEVFCPLFLSPVTDIPQEIYRFGEKGSGLYESILQWINFRYLILPYIYSHAREMNISGYPLLRPPGLEFPADKKAGSIENEFMFGPSFLIRPVTEHQYYKPKTDSVGEQMMLKPMYDSVDCYLPSGAAWFDLFTGRRFDGGQMISTPSPLEVIPVFVKAGSIIPYYPRVQYAAEKKPDSVDLRIYPGADADFTLYEDENSGDKYQTGAFSVIPIHWNDKEMTLTIGQRVGDFPGMLEQRTFRICLISPLIPEGFSIAPVSEKMIKYSGEQTSLKIK